VQRRLQNCFAIFQVCFYGMAGCGGTPGKPAYSLPKGRLPEYNGRVFVNAGPCRFVLQAHGFAVWFPGPVFCGFAAKNAHK
jgi:hypothetical protein